MKVFNSFLAFSKQLAKVEATNKIAIAGALTTAAKIVQRKAKSEIGHLQDAAGPFPEWEELAEYTKDDKTRKGFVFNDEFNPLLRTGALRDSIKISVHPESSEAIVGSKSVIMAYQEYGTKTIPPRPVIGRAAFVKKNEIQKTLGLMMTMHLKGDDIGVEQFGKLVYGEE